MIGILKEPDKPTPDSASMELFLDDDDIENAKDMADVDAAG